MCNLLFPDAVHIVRKERSGLTLVQVESYQANWSWVKHTETWLKLQIERGYSVLSFPCGKSRIGLRVDIDRSVKPDVIADFYHPPFKKHSFDVVISDPPFSAYGKGKKWFWVAMSDLAKHKIILSTNLRHISGIKGKKSIFMMCDSPNYMRCFQVFDFNKFGYPKKQRKLTEVMNMPFILSDVESKKSQDISQFRLDEVVDQV